MDINHNFIAIWRNNTFDMVVFTLIVIWITLCGPRVVNLVGHWIYEEFAAFWSAFMVDVEKTKYAYELNSLKEKLREQMEKAVADEMEKSSQSPSFHPNCVIQGDWIKLRYHDVKQMARIVEQYNVPDFEQVPCDIMARVGILNRIPGDALTPTRDAAVQLMFIRSVPSRRMTSTLVNREWIQDSGREPDDEKSKAIFERHMRAGSFWDKSPWDEYCESQPNPNPGTNEAAYLRHQSRVCEQCGGSFCPMCNTANKNVLNTPCSCDAKLVEERGKQIELERINLNVTAPTKDPGELLDRQKTKDLYQFIAGFSDNPPVPDRDLGVEDTVRLRKESDPDPSLDPGISF